MIPLSRPSIRSTPIACAIRPLAEEDRAALLRLNADNYPAVHRLNADTLAHLLGYNGHHWVAVDREGSVVGYLLSFARECDYDDSEIRELRRRVAEPFLYICQIVIAQTHRRQRIGHALYETMADAARCHGIQVLCCDVNTDPPNPDSLAFHHRQDFVEIGSGIASNGMAIVFLRKTLSP
jgi:predicted GNAT superfamily acetyltransferase